mmetsp:Transcript_30991/g.82171  ORF Transcript_30991/g.82171 Transcript_30991/m.82171 type:complete len:222 (+) Transcript_30991:182-847(+)
MVPASAFAFALPLPKYLANPFVNIGTLREIQCTLGCHFEIPVKRCQTRAVHILGDLEDVDHMFGFVQACLLEGTDLLFVVILYVLQDESHTFALVLALASVLLSFHSFLFFLLFLRVLILIRLRLRLRHHRRLGQGRRGTEVGGAKEASEAGAGDMFLDRRVGDGQGARRKGDAHLVSRSGENAGRPSSLLCGTAGAATALHGAAQDRASLVSPLGQIAGS